MTVSLGGVCTFHSRFETLKSVFKCRVHFFYKSFLSLKDRSELFCK